jgi:hypothetical protein
VYRKHRIHLTECDWKVHYSKDGTKMVLLPHFVVVVVVVVVTAAAAAVVGKK